MSSDPTVEEIKSRLNLAEFVQEYVPLKRAGVNWKGLCPFHHEKTPSFMVHADRGFWHCFGCSEGGDIFSFLQKIEGLEFGEALRFLADKTGVALPERHVREVQKSQRERLLKILALAAAFYHKVLTDSPKAAEARNYLAGRGVREESIETFTIGYAPAAWDTLTNFLAKRGYGANDNLAAGLVMRNERGGFYDRFRDRIMFPIATTHGEIVGFTGRLLHETPEAGGKYVNSPQTELFDKGKILYGMHLAKAPCRQKGYLVIVEGQMDVIASRAARVENVVAASGTALTDAHVQLISRYTKNVRIAFDADRAGEAATRRGIAVALAHGLAVDIITMQDAGGKDPDDCVQKDPALWVAAVERARPYLEVALEVALHGLNRNDARQKGDIAENILSLVGALPSSVEQDHWIKKLATALDASPAALYEDLKRLHKGSRITHRKQMPDGPQRTTDMRTELSESILALVKVEPALIALLPPNIEEYFTSKLFHTLYAYIKQAYTQLDSVQEQTAHFEHADAHNEPPALDPDLERHLATLELRAHEEYATLSRDEREITLRQMVTRLHDAGRKEKRAALGREIAVAEAAGNTAELAKLMDALREI